MAYFCPMHAEVRQARPWQVAASPLHLAVMVAAMAAVMAAAMMLIH